MLGNKRHAHLFATRISMRVFVVHPIFVEDSTIASGFPPSSVGTSQARAYTHYIHPSLHACITHLRLLWCVCCFLFFTVSLGGSLGLCT